MSGGSGFYRFRCKNFLTYNCKNWVWVNHSACAECVAAGRDDQIMDNTVPHETVVPFAESGRLVSKVVEPEGDLPAEDTVVARTCRDNHHDPESWETEAHVHPCHQH